VILLAAGAYLPREVLVLPTGWHTLAIGVELEAVAAVDGHADA
jgi:hypothetical protein